MTLSKYERGNTVKTDVDFMMSGTMADPSGSNAWVHIIKSNGDYLVSGGSAIRDGTGEYHYFFTPAADDPLGVYVIEWYGYHYIGGSFGAMKIVQRDAIQIVDVSQ